MTKRRLSCLAVMALIGTLWLAEPGLAQEAPPSGGPVLDNTESLVTGGALQSRRPGLVTGRARARFAEATARVGQRFPLQQVDTDAGQEDRKFGAELLNSVLETVFDEINSFLLLLNSFISFGQGGGDLTDLTGLLEDLTGQPAPDAGEPGAPAKPLPLPTADLLPESQREPSQEPGSF